MEDIFFWNTQVYFVAPFLTNSANFFLLFLHIFYDRASEIISAISSSAGRATWSEVDSSNAELQSLSNILDRTSGNDIDDDLAYARFAI